MPAEKGSETEVYAALILAGGRSRRMGRDKLMLPQEGTTVLEATVRRFSEKFDRVLLSVDRPDRYPDIAVTHVTDAVRSLGSTRDLKQPEETAFSSQPLTCRFPIPKRPFV